MNRKPRYLVTRAPQGARQWALRLEALGAEAVYLPCLVCRPVEEPKAVADLATQLTAALDGAQWLALTSVHGVDAAASLLRFAAAAVPPEVRICAVGPATTERCVESLGRCDLMSAKATGRALAERILREARQPGGSKRLVIAAADRGRRDFEEVLEHAGVDIHRFAVYQTLPAAREEPRRDLQQLALDAILLASPSAVEGLLNIAEIPSTVPVVTIGPTTSAAARASGLEVTAEAASPTIEGMLEAIHYRSEL